MHTRKKATMMASKITQLLRGAEETIARGRTLLQERDAEIKRLNELLDNAQRHAEEWQASYHDAVKVRYERDAEIKRLRAVIQDAYDNTNDPGTVARLGNELKGGDDE